MSIRAASTLRCLPKRGLHTSSAILNSDSPQGPGAKSAKDLGFGTANVGRTRDLGKLMIPVRPQINIKSASSRSNDSSNSNFSDSRENNNRGQAQQGTRSFDQRAPYNGGRNFQRNDRAARGETAAGGEIPAATESQGASSQGNRSRPQFSSTDFYGGSQALYEGGPSGQSNRSPKSQFSRGPGAQGDRSPRSRLDRPAGPQLDRSPASQSQSTPVGQSDSSEAAAPARSDRPISGRKSLLDRIPDAALNSTSDTAPAKPSFVSSGPNPRNQPNQRYDRGNRSNVNSARADGVTPDIATGDAQTASSTAGAPRYPPRTGGLGDGQRGSPARNPTGPRGPPGGPAPFGPNVPRGPGMPGGPQGYVRAPGAYPQPRGSYAPRGPGGPSGPGGPGGYNAQRGPSGFRRGPPVRRRAMVLGGARVDDEAASTFAQKWTAAPPPPPVERAQDEKTVFGQSLLYSTLKSPTLEMVKNEVWARDLDKTQTLKTTLLRTAGSYSTRLPTTPRPAHPSVASSRQKRAAADLSWTLAFNSSVLDQDIQKAQTIAEKFL